MREWCHAFETYISAVHDANAEVIKQLPAVMRNAISAHSMELPMSSTTGLRTLQRWSIVEPRYLTSCLHNHLHNDSCAPGAGVRLQQVLLSPAVMLMQSSSAVSHCVCQALSLQQRFLSCLPA